MPLKRDPNLVPLSHQHHQGLIFALRLKKSAKAEDRVIRDFVQDFWEHDLQLHFEKEEELLLPVMADGELKKRFLEEHKVIRSLVEQILTDGTPVKTLAQSLGETVNEHIRFEERELFPALEAGLSAEQLRTIGKGLEEIEAGCRQFRPEFWRDK